MRLALAFFLVGWFGIHAETLIADAIQEDCGQISDPACPQREHAVNLATLTTALLCAGTGALIARRRRQWPVAASYLPPVGGVLNAGLLTLLLLGDPAAMVLALPFGLVFGLFYIPFAWLLAYAHFDAKTPTAVWRATALTLLGCFVLGCATPCSSIAGPGLAMLTTLFLILWSLVADARRLLRRQRPAPPHTGGPYRQAPVTPLEDSAPLFRRALVLDGLLLATAVMLVLCYGWLSRR
jgi:hypothetical protein